MNKKIVFFINSLAGGGAERVVTTLLNHLVAKYDCFLILIENQTHYDLDKRINIINLNENKNNSKTAKLLRLPIITYKFNKIIKKHKFKTIVSFLHRANYINIVSSFFSLHKIVISERTMPSSMYTNNSLNSLIHKFLIKKLYNKANHIIAVSKVIISDLDVNFGVRVAKTAIYNPYDLTHIKTLASKKSKITIDKNINIISVGSLIERKNYPLLLKSMANIEQNFNLYILGSGEKKSNLEQLTKSLKIDNKVFFLNFDNNPYKYLSKCGIFILSSNVEGFPNVVVEAMACGCAIIATDCLSGPREILAPDTDINIQLKINLEIAEYGILTPVNNIEKMTEAIKLILSNKTLRNEFATKAIRRAKDFRIDKIAKKYQQICVD